MEPNLLWPSVDRFAKSEAIGTRLYEGWENVFLVGNAALLSTRSSIVPVRTCRRHKKLKKRKSGSHVKKSENIDLEDPTPLTRHVFLCCTPREAVTKDEILNTICDAYLNRSRRRFFFLKNNSSFFRLLGLGRFGRGGREEENEKKCYRTQDREHEDHEHDQSV